MRTDRPRGRCGPKPLRRGRSRLVWVAVFAALGAAASDWGLAAPSEYRAAMPGYRFEFPRDHFEHPDFQTEWWYYTGNLEATDGRRYGFELTFFRQAVSRDRDWTTADSPWTVRDLYFAHLAVSDLDAGAFHHEERINRAGPGLAGASAAARRIWNGNWQVLRDGDVQRLDAVADRFSVRLQLDPQKPPIVHGREGVSQKAAGPGRGSHYISFTRLAARGSIEIDGVRRDVQGTAWMDHEFFTHQLDANQAGWDWFSVQLDDQTEVMLFRLRRKDGAADPFSAGTFVDRDGSARHLAASDFTLTPAGRTWRSRATGATYPVAWRIVVPALGLTLTTRTALASQEIVSRRGVTPNYWEGAIAVSGYRGGQAISGAGYLEMTGYDRAVRLGLDGG